MAKTLMKALHTEMTADLPAVAALLQKKGRGKDTILAHITPKEAALLKQRGGRGSKNPDTGLLEFDDGGTIDFGGGFEGTPEQTQAAYNIPQTETPAFSGGAAPSTGGVPYQDQTANMAAPAYSENYKPPAAPTPSEMGSLANIQGVPLAQGGLGTPGQGAISGQMGTVGTDYVPPTPSYGGGVTTTSVQAKPPADTGLLTQLNEALGTKLTAGQLLGGGALGALGIQQVRNAQKQAEQETQQLQQLAAPYQQQGARQVAAAQAGQLSPASQQAYQAAQARAAQAGLAAGGGVGVVQSEAALESLRQQLLAGDLNLGLQIQAIGDKIAQGAIQAGVQADNSVAALTQSYATNVARALYGAAPGGQTQTITIPTA
jgi:hypothetical protein